MARRNDTRGPWRVRGGNLALPIRNEAVDSVPGSTSLRRTGPVEYNLEAPASGKRRSAPKSLAPS
jgi:hypothetical protein